MTASRLIDVANAAGVSLRTASRVLNDDHRVAETTRERVRAAMANLQFQPDEMARSLRVGTDTTVGLVVESIADPFFGAVIEAVEATLAAQGRSVLVASTHRDGVRESDVVARMLQRRVSGLLLVPTGQLDAHQVAGPTPLVVVDRPLAGQADDIADLVDIDNHRAAFDAVSHLVAHGHREIGYIGDVPSVPTSAARLRGFRDALAAAGLPVREHLVRADCATSEAAATAVARLLDDPDCTALFSATVRGSMGILPVLHARGRTDLGLVALGDFAMADALSPGVTVVDHSGVRLGRAAAHRLLQRIATPDLPTEHIRLPAPIIERGSGEVRP